MFHTKFEQLFENPDVMVALWLCFFWRGQHRADDEGLHLAVRAMMQRGELTASRWESIRAEAKCLDACIERNAPVPDWARLDPTDLAVAAGKSLDLHAREFLRERVSTARRRTAEPGAAPDAQLAYLEGLLMRDVENAPALVS